MKPINVIQRLNESEISGKLQDIANTIEKILTECHADVSYVDVSEYAGRGDKDCEIMLSCHFPPESFSKYTNEVSLYGRLLFNNNDLKLTSADLTTSSGPNVLNHDFIHALNAIYTYIESGYNHYDM